MVTEFEDMPGGQGAEFTQLWLRYYETYVTKSNDIFSAFSFMGDDDVDEPLSYEMLPAFLDILPYMKNVVKLDENDTLTAFVFRFGLANASSWTARVDYMHAVREIAKRHTVCLISQSIINQSIRISVSPSGRRWACNVTQ